MAKKQRTTTKWHKKHVSTGWGLAILSFLLLVTIVLIPIVKQQQDSLIDAAGLSKSDQIIVNKHLSCTVGTLKGVCKQVTGTSTGFFAAGHCPGSSAVQCYVSQNVSCSTPVGKGTCHNTSNSAGSGTFVPGYCPGPNNVQCLVPNAKVQSNTSASCKSQKIGNNATPDCEVAGTHAKGGMYYTGFCPGPTNVKCWVPGATSTKTAGGSGGGVSTPVGQGGGSGTSSSICATMLGGTCQSTSAHKNGVGGSYHPGYCPGASNIQCWVPGSSSGNGTGTGKGTGGGPGASCGNGGTCINGQICRGNPQDCHPIAGTCSGGLICNGPTTNSAPPPATPKCVATTQYYDGVIGGAVTVCTQWSPAKPCLGGKIGFYDGVTGQAVYVCKNWILSKYY